MTCPHCGADILEIDVRCGKCGGVVGASGAHAMIGQVALGQYEITDVLGQGGMSVVFKGKHKLTEQEVALKILPPEMAAHSQVKSRFLDEAKALAALDHGNIVHLYNFGQENGSFVLAMQFVQGATWERMILEHKRLDWRTSCKIAIDVLRALEYAHGRGVVHRDMKPSNVLVRADDGSATVMDFGIAKMTTSTRLTATGQTMGTVRYMSPEQVRGQDVDLRTDIYSLGATLYESLTGDTPFDGSTHFEIMTKHLSEVPKRPSALGVEVPVAVEDALMRCLSKRADDRFENARELRKVIEGALRAGDLGLVETQRLGSEALGELRASASKPVDAGASLPPGPAQRVATASDLADQLEPGLTGAMPRRRRGALPWIALGVLVAGAGGVAAVMLLRGPGGYRSTVVIDGVDLPAGVRYGQLLIESDGTIPPADVVPHYDAALAELRAVAEREQVELGATDPIDQLVVIPQPALCRPSAYGDPRLIPTNCATATYVVTAGGSGARRLYVAADRATLGAAVASGVAQAICDFPPNHAEAASKQRFERVCSLRGGRFVAGE